MRCPSCKEPDTRVVDSRDLDDGSVIRRRRACRICGTRVTTYERAELAKLYVIMRSGERQEYDSQKLLEGLRRALTRRPVPVDAPERAVEAIEAQIRASGATELRAPQPRKALQSQRTMSSRSSIINHSSIRTM